MKALLTLALVWLAWPALACDLPADYVPIHERAPKALLYEISGCNAPKHILFGTYHSDSPKLAPMIEQLLPHLWQSKRLWVEIVSAPELMAQTQQFLLLPPESPNLQTLVGDDVYAEIKAKITPILGLPEETLQRFRPWALALLVQYPKPVGDGIILDARLQQLAARKAIMVSGFETLPQQMAIFTQMPKPMQLDFMRYTLKHLGDIQTSIQTLEASYLQQDIMAIERLSKKQLGQMREELPELADYLEQKLIDERNDLMTRAIRKKLHSPAFIAVGALHLTGETGILAQLERSGWQIQPINTQ